MKKIFNWKTFWNTLFIMGIMYGSKIALDGDKIFSWEAFGGFILLSISLIIFDGYNNNGEIMYKEGYKMGCKAQKIWHEVYKKINEGTEDEFNIEVENELAHNYIVLMGCKHNCCSEDDRFKYYISEIENLGTTSKITFRKENRL